MKIISIKGELFADQNSTSFMIVLRKEQLRIRKFKKDVIFLKNEG